MQKSRVFNFIKYAKKKGGFLLLGMIMVLPVHAANFICGRFNTWDKEPVLTFGAIVKDDNNASFFEEQFQSMGMVGFYCDNTADILDKLIEQREKYGYEYVCVNYDTSTQINFVSVETRVSFRMSNCRSLTGWNCPGQKYFDAAQMKCQACPDGGQTLTNLKNMDKTKCYRQDGTDETGTYRHYGAACYWSSGE